MRDITEVLTTTRRRAVTSILLAGLFATPEAAAQDPPRAPVHVFVRELRVHPLLTEAGVDTVSLRRALEDLLREAQKLGSAAGRGTPSLDVAVIVPRSVAGVPPDPHALVRFEVGRNLLESGAERRLAWERSATLPQYATWRALGTAARRAVIQGVQAYLSGEAGA